MKSTNIKLLYDFLILTENKEISIFYNYWGLEKGTILFCSYFTFQCTNGGIYTENIKKNYESFCEKINQLRGFYWIIPDNTKLNEIETLLELSIKKTILKGKIIYKYQYNITTDWSMPNNAKLYKTKWFDSQEECFINALEIAKSKYSL